MTSETSTTDTAGARRKVNWAAGVTAFAALLSATAAMLTAAAGVWRPPVPIPVPRVSITWVGPSPVAAQQAQPAASAMPAAVLSPSPTPSAAGRASTTYHADWSSGMDGWVGVAQWKTIPGALISDGSSRLPQFQATRGANSVQPPQQPSASDYAVEARIQIVDPTVSGCYVDLQVRVETEGDGTWRHGYTLGFAQGVGAVVGRFAQAGGWTSIKQTSFSPGSDWHTYRAEVKQNQLTLKIDGSTVLVATDNNYLGPGQVGIQNSYCQVQVSGFDVTPL